LVFYPIRIYRIQKKKERVRAEYKRDGSEEGATRSVGVTPYPGFAYETIAVGEMVIIHW